MKDGQYTVSSIPLETYVSRVLAGEAARDSRPAALEALAITIRTFALANRGRHRADSFDLCDQTHCQVVRAATAATDRAATATAGQVLMHGAALASIYYTASCGGRTEIPSAVWPGADDPPYLPSRKDDACGGTPVWSAELTRGELSRALARAGFRGELRDLRIVSRDPSGRVASLRLEGLTPDRISGQDLRVAVGRTLGWLLIKSTAFDLKPTGRGADAPYEFSGHGSGHGVGLCVIGSARLAASGERADAILARYFPGATIAAPGPAFVASARDPGAFAASRATAPTAAAAPSPEVLLSLPDDDEGERALITSMALTARDELARALGVGTPKRITLRFHGAVDEYAQVTGRPWFTSGAAANGELHLVPLTVLRDRGVLERTIRHEMVHVLTADVLAGRPQWVREGAAIHFAGERDVPGSPAARTAVKGSCPSDIELLQPVSAGALANAYARARGCFEKQIAGGRSWKEIR